MEHLDVTVENGVGVMTWHHESQNRFTTPFMDETLQALKELEKDSAVNSVVVTSSLEKYFSTGLHLEWVMMQSIENPENVRSFMETLSTFLKTLLVFPKPMVAAINGHAIGAGVFVSACMDYRYMRADKGFVSLPEVKMNMSFWPGVSVLLVDTMTAKGFRDMAYTGDKLNAEAAFRLGFIDACFSQEDLLPNAIEKASILGQNASDAFATIKRESRRHILNTMEKEDPKAIDDYMATIKL